jgi:hypothetical protein
MQGNVHLVTGPAGPDALRWQTAFARWGEGIVLQNRRVQGSIAVPAIPIPYAPWKSGSNLPRGQAAGTRMRRALPPKMHPMAQQGGLPSYLRVG